MSRSENITLTVLIPCYNEANILRDTYDKTVDFLDNKNWSCGLEKTWELIFVNDGSTDDTLCVLEDLSKIDSRVRICSYKTNGGQGKALQYGFENSSGQWIVCFDADLDYSVDHIESFLKVAIDNNADIVVGSPYCKSGKTSNVPIIRNVMSRMMNYYFSRVLQLGLSTYTGILRLYRSNAIKNIFLISHDKDILPEILIKAHLLNMKIVETPAYLCWNKNEKRSRSNIKGIVFTAKKAVQHLLLGLYENPLMFLFWPIVISTATCIWLSIAIMMLFISNFEHTTQGLATDITYTFVSILGRSFQTFLFLLIAFQTNLFLMTIGVVIYQNRVKKHDDFVMISKILNLVKK